MTYRNESELRRETLINRPLTAIRTEKHVTITEAHPYHGYVYDHRDRGGNAVVFVQYVERCPLCRASVPNERTEDGGSA